MRTQNRTMQRQSQAQHNDQMTVEEIQIAISFLKKRFSQYSLEEIMLSLTQKLQKDRTQSRGIYAHTSPFSQIRQTYGQEQDRPLMFRTRHTQPIRDQRELREKVYSISVNNEQNLNKFEEIRLVAKFFCEVGSKFSLVRYFFPQMSPQQYRCYLQTITNQVINQIQKFLRYECNIQIEHMSTEQKRSLKGQLVKVRDWLGPKSASQLQTFFKFVQRHYEQKDIEITYDEALKLYKTFLEIIKSPFIDIMQIVPSQQNTTERVPPSHIRMNTPHSAPLSSFTKEEEKTIVEFYLILKDISKVSQKLIETRGQSLKWKTITVKALLRYIIRKSIKKLILSKEKYLKQATPICFSDSQPFANSLFDSQQATQLKDTLLKFHIANRITVTGISKVINQLNDFSNNDSSCSMIEVVDQHNQDISIIPKVQFQSKKQPIIVEQPNSNVPYDLTQEQKMEEIQANRVNEASDKNSQQTNEPKEQYLCDPVTYEQIIEIE